MRVALAVALAISLSACALLEPLTKPVSTVEFAVCKPLDAATKSVCNEAGQTIDKAYLLITAINQTIAEDVTAGVITKDQAIAVLTRSKEARAKVDSAFNLFASGNYSVAASQAKLTQSLLLALQKELAAEAAKGTK